MPEVESLVRPIARLEVCFSVDDRDELPVFVCGLGLRVGVDVEDLLVCFQGINNLVLPLRAHVRGICVVFFEARIRHKKKFERPVGSSKLISISLNILGHVRDAGVIRTESPWSLHELELSVNRRLLALVLEALIVPVLKVCVPEVPRCTRLEAGTR